MKTQETGTGKGTLTEEFLTSQEEIVRHKLNHDLAELHERTGRDYAPQLGQLLGAMIQHSDSEHSAIEFARTTVREFSRRVELETGTQVGLHETARCTQIIRSMHELGDRAGLEALRNYAKALEASHYSH